MAVSEKNGATLTNGGLTVLGRYLGIIKIIFV